MSEQKLTAEQIENTAKAMYAPVSYGYAWNTLSPHAQFEYRSYAIAAASALHCQYQQAQPQGENLVGPTVASPATNDEALLSECLKAYSSVAGINQRPQIPLPTSQRNQFMAIIAAVRAHDQRIGTTVPERGTMNIEELQSAVKKVLDELKECRAARSAGFIISEALAAGYSLSAEELRFMASRMIDSMLEESSRNSKRDT